MLHSKLTGTFRQGREKKPPQKATSSNPVKFSLGTSEHFSI